jgi:hypothetical protein
MPRTEFSREAVVASSPERCWKTVTDVPPLDEWVGVVEHAREITHVSRYSAMLADRIGPFRLGADIDIDVDEPHRIHVVASGEDLSVDSRPGDEFFANVVCDLGAA